MPGFGLNAHRHAPDSLRGFAEYVLDALDHQGIDSFHLVGHSMGGMIAQEFMKLAAHRVEKLVLYGTGPVGMMPGRFETVAESRHRIQVEGVTTTARRIAAKWFVGGEHEKAYAACAEIAVMASQQAALAGLTAMEHWSGLAALNRITAPTLVLWGDQDQSYRWPQPETLWQGIPGAGLSVVAGCAHAVHLEKPALFNAILHDFLV